MALGILVVGCGGDDTPSAEADATPAHGGSLTVSMPTESATFDPIQASSYSVAGGSRLSAVYDTLLRTDPTTGTVRAQIAESFLPDKEYRVWTLRIQPNVRFSDGSVFDAAAVRMNWERNKDPKSRQSFAVAPIASMEVRPGDPLALRVSLTKPNANFDRNVAANLSFIASPKALANPDMLREHPVGAGPFILSESAPGRQVYVRNPDYWQKDKGLPHLDRVVIQVDADVAHTVADIGNGIDFTVAVTPEDIARARARDLGVEELRLNGGSMVTFNNAHGPFTDARARRAFVYALSSAEIIQVCHEGAGTPAKGIFSTTSRIGNSQLATAENDPAKAAQLFDEVTANGARPLEFTYTIVPAPASRALARYIEDKLRAYRGVVMHVQEMDAPSFLNTVRKGSTAWDVAMGSVWADDPDPRIHDYLHSSSPANISSFADPEVDAALDEARLTTGAARSMAYTRVQVRVNEKMPFWAYREAEAAGIHGPRVTGVRLFNDGLVSWETIGFSK